MFRLKKTPTAKWKFIQLLPHNCENVYGDWPWTCVHFKCNCNCFCDLCSWGFPAPPLHAPTTASSLAGHHDVPSSPANTAHLTLQKHTCSVSWAINTTPLLRRMPAKLLPSLNFRFTWTVRPFAFSNICSIASSDIFEASAAVLLNSSSPSSACNLWSHHAHSTSTLTSQVSKSSSAISSFGSHMVPLK